MIAEQNLIIERRRRKVSGRLIADLARELDECPDVAFAHLPEVYVPGRQPRPELVLFVWFVPGALASLRSALNLVSEIVARVLPEEDYLDVVVLNSAPELLSQVERADSLLVERIPEERQRALVAAQAAGEPETLDPSPWWWPFRRR